MSSSVHLKRNQVMLSKTLWWDGGDQEKKFKSSLTIIWTNLLMLAPSSFTLHLPCSKERQSRNHVYNVYGNSINVLQVCHNLWKNLWKDSEDIEPGIKYHIIYKEQFIVVQCLECSSFWKRNYLIGIMKFHIFLDQISPGYRNNSVCPNIWKPDLQKQLRLVFLRYHHDE